MTSMTLVEPIRAALDEVAANGAARTVFFRNDDGGWDNPLLFRLLDVFDEAEAPIDLAIIPSVCNAELARELLRRKGEARIGLHQHGWTHTNHEPTGRKCEFGSARSPAVQLADISAGWERLSDLLGPAVDAVFTPPWNRCTQATATALDTLGFAALSRDHTAVPFDQTAFLECPVTFDWSKRIDGYPREAAQIVAELARQLRTTNTCGVMLHHAVMNDNERFLLSAILEVFTHHDAVRLVTLPVAAGVVA